MNNTSLKRIRKDLIEMNDWKTLTWLAQKYVNKLKL